MKSVFANNWRPHSGFLGARGGVAAAPVAAPLSVQFAPPTSYIYPPADYVYPPGYTYPGVYEVTAPPVEAAPSSMQGAMPYVIGGAVLLGVAALIANSSK